MRKEARSRGKLNINKYFQHFDTGEKVILSVDPTMQNGVFPYCRFQGKVGNVMGTQGACYKISLKDGGKTKTFIVHPVHLQPLRDAA
jgi:large subunit ribosomal protein L21e